MDGDFFGRGWRFPISAEARPPGGTGGGQIRRSDVASSIAESIWLILGTAKGERVMRPDFGCGIHDLVFAPNDAATASRVAAEVEGALLLWEPRIDVLSVRTATPRSQPETMMISISYRARATDSVSNLVYPFYLDQVPE